MESQIYRVMLLKAILLNYCIHSTLYVPSPLVSHQVLYLIIGC
jgi:hypothetical protein